MKSAMALRDGENPVHWFEDRARILDIDLGQWLELERPRSIRELIYRNLDRLESRCRTVRHRPDRGGTEYNEYWLDEEGMLIVCMLSQAPRADEVREFLLKCFKAVKEGLFRPTENGLVEYRQFQQALVEGVIPLINQSEERLKSHVSAEVIPIKAELAEVKGEILEVKQLVLDHVKNKREDFSRATQIQMLAATRNHPTLQGKCLYCKAIEVVDDRYCIPIKDGKRVAQFDHAENRNDHNFDNCSLPCLECHDKKHHPRKHGKGKGWWRKHFDSFHEDIAAFAREKEKPSKPPDPSQSSFFENPEY